mgnify:FL=1
MQKFKMNKATYREYLAQNIFFDMGTPVWGSNGSAIVGMATTKGKKNPPMQVEVEVLRYWPQRVY